MKKMHIITIVVLLLGLLLTGCANKTDKSAVGNEQNASKDQIADAKTAKGDIGDDLCAEFSTDFINSATGKAVVKV